MSSFDLDINNYTHKDLVNFFKLSNTDYSVSDVELRETAIREQLLKSGNVEKKFKSKIIDFLNRAKEKLMIAKMNIKNEIFEHTTLAKNQKLFSTDYPASKHDLHRHLEITQRPETEFVHVQTSEFLPGKINPLKTRVISKCLTIDTRFRDNFYETTSSNFQFQMPLKLNKVVSMQLSSFEIPVSFYGISKSYGNNYLYINILINANLFSPNGTILLNENGIVKLKDNIPIELVSLPERNEYMKILPGDTYVEMTKVITIPDGNYNSQDLINQINDAICPLNTLTNAPLYPNNIFSYVSLNLDITTSGSGSGKVSITTNGNYYYLIQSLSLDFTKNAYGITDNTSVSSKIGWNLGYTQHKYTGTTNYSSSDLTKAIGIKIVADTIIEPATIRYIYLAIDDFNNSVNDLFLTAFNNSLMSPNVLARISIKGSYFSLLMENDLTVVTEPRTYFGPVDIQKIKVQLYDDFGRILDMNNANYSFCITFKMLHDL